MAEVQVPAEAESAGKSGGGHSMIALLGVAVVSAGIGFAVPFVLPGKETDKKPKSSDTVKLDLPEPIGKPAFIKFGETVVNLDEGSLTRYLRLGVTLQVDEAQLLKIDEMVEKRKAILRNWLLSYLSDLGMDDIRGAAGQNRLRREIQDYFNTELFTDGYDRIEDVLFDDFNVQ